MPEARAREILKLLSVQMSAEKSSSTQYQSKSHPTPTYAQANRHIDYSLFGKQSYKHAYATFKFSRFKVIKTSVMTTHFQQGNFLYNDTFINLVSRALRVFH